MALLVAALVAPGCSLQPSRTPADAGADVRPDARPDALPACEVAVYVTTGDQGKLLSREPDIQCGAIPSSAVVGTIELFPAEVYQEIVGFGAAITDASAILIQTKLTVAARDALMGELFGRDPGIGLSLIRLTVGASDFSPTHYSFDDMPAGETDFPLEHFSIEPNRPYLIPTVKQALALNPALKVMASPWSPPGWMKTTGSLLQGTLRDDAHDAFSGYWVKYLQAYAGEGIPIWAITLQNEPGFEPADYPGMRLDAPLRAHLLAFHLGPELARAGIEARIFDWDHNWNVPESPLAVLADPDARPYVDGVAWHCYDGDISAQSRVHDQYPDIDTYSTECTGGAWSTSFADNLKSFTSLLVIGATRNWSNGVLLWNLALDENHGPRNGGCDSCQGVVTIDSTTGVVRRNEEYYVLAHASRFVLPGARRIGATTGIADLESAAFRNPDGTTVLIVLNSADGARTFGVALADETFWSTLPGEAVATFRWP